MKYITFLVLALIIVGGLYWWTTTQSNVLPTPMVTPTTSASPQGTGNIHVFSPQPNNSVGLPLVIKGEARVFEGTFAYRIIDSNDAILLEDHGMTSGQHDIGEFDPFEVSVNYPAPKGKTGRVE